jgi:hypothetical protein
MLDPWKVRQKAEALGLRKLSNLADRAGVTVGALSSLMTYRRVRVSPERVAEALGCTVADLDSDVTEYAANCERHRAWVAAGCPSVVVSP